MSIDIPLVIDWHYIDTQLVSHWMSIGITLTVKYFNWQQIGIQLAMDWHRLYWIGIPYLSAGTSQKVRPQTWRLAVRLSWVWLAPDWVLISGHWRIIPAFALHWLNWHEFQFRTFELHWRWIGIITNPLPILVGFDWLGCIGLEKSGALYIWVIYNSLSLSVPCTLYLQVGKTAKATMCLTHCCSLKYSVLKFAVMHQDWGKV